MTKSKKKNSELNMPAKSKFTSGVCSGASFPDIFSASCRASHKTTTGSAGYCSFVSKMLSGTQHEVLRWVPRCCRVYKPASEHPMRRMLFSVWMLLGF